MSLDIDFYSTDDEQISFHNITSNLFKMAEAAGLAFLWDLKNEIKAEYLIVPVTQGIKTIKSNPEHFEKFNAANGWGNVSEFLLFLNELLASAKQHPSAVIK